MMRIALLITSLGVAGAERLVVDLADRFASLGHSVLVIYLTGSAEVLPTHPGVKVFSLPSVDHPEYGRHIELGVKGEAVLIDEAYARLLTGLHGFEARLCPELVR